MLTGSKYRGKVSESQQVREILSDGLMGIEFAMLGFKFSVSCVDHGSIQDMNFPEEMNLTVIKLLEPNSNYRKYRE